MTWYTPDGTLREAVTSINWWYTFALLIAPCTLVGVAEGIPTIGFLVGMIVPVQWILMSWWMGAI